MPTISKIRFVNVVYEDGGKRYNDEVFDFANKNGAIVLENGGGKTVFLHTALQAVLPHEDLGKRKIKETLQLENTAAHIGIEWLKHDHPKRYVATCVTLFMTENRLESYRYVYEYGEDDEHSLVNMPFTKETDGYQRPAGKEEANDYFLEMKRTSHNAQTFDTIKSFQQYIEKNHQIIADEWRKVARINSEEGGVEKFFENCQTTQALYDRLLIPTVEQAISGNRKGLFADTFENQREGFKEYKRLKEKLRSNEQIEARLHAYINTFSVLETARNAMTAARERAKGAWQLGQVNRNEIEQQQMKNEAEWAVHERNERQHILKKASYSLLLSELRREELEKDYHQKLVIHEEAKERLEADVNRLNSLKYGLQKQAAKAAGQMAEHYQRELDRHGQTVDHETLQDELQDKKAELNGCFKQELEAIEREQTGLRHELSPLQRQLDELVGRRKHQQQSLDAAKRQLTIKETEVASARNRIVEIEKRILANRDNERIETEYKGWTERLGYLEEGIVKLEADQRALVKQLAATDADRESVGTELNEVESARLLEQQTLEGLFKEEKKLIAELGTLKGKWGAIENLHLQESSVQSKLLEMLGQAQDAFETILQQERISRRFLDDYGEQDSFFGDAFLKEQLDAWRGQFAYLQSGVEFLASQTTEQRERLQKGVVWPLVVLTTGEQKEQLQAKIENVSGRLQFPISVMSLDEAAKEAGFHHGNWIMPEHWNSNLDGEHFNQWKNEIAKTAEGITAERKDKEAGKRRLELILNNFETFFNEFPAKRKEAIEEVIREYGREIAGLSRKQKALNAKTAELKEKQENLTRLHANHVDEKHVLEPKIEYANEYFNIVLKMKESEIKIRELRGSCTKYEQELDNISGQEIRLGERIKELESQIQDLGSHAKHIQASEEYRDVSHLTPIYTGQMKSVIKGQMTELELEIHKIRKSFETIEASLGFETENVQKAQTQMADLLKEHPDLDRDIICPADTENQIRSIQESLPKQKENLKQLDKARQNSHDDCHAEEVLLEDGRKRFSNEFPDEQVHEFSSSPEQTESELEEEAAALQSRKEALEREKERLEKEHAELVRAETELGKFERVYDLGSTLLNGTEFTEQEKIEFLYNRNNFVRKIIAKLEEMNDRVQEAETQVNEEKQTFKEFLDKKVDDAQLRRSAMQGVDNRKTYDELIQFQELMSRKISVFTKYANDSIRTQDRELQALIGNMNNHLLSIVRELRQIPKKTKVKVDGVSREIFSFHIPEWSEEEGRILIRSYLDWIIGQLDSDRFLNEHHMEDKTKIRTEIEKWLDTKQLLEVVMKREAMKVSCRKVTSDRRVSSRSYPWEKSNKWSGGEQWSKNMTLFLGILDYVAEKKIAVNSKTKRRRAVLLDNPFGKASSEHVLRPVFFIAEQLGFQIIALTAHAEGEFLQRYFPVIYSCRLRATGDPTKKIVEKSVRHAYFKDHDPAGVHGLGDEGT